MLIRQDKQELQLDLQQNGGWTSEVLSGPGTTLRLPEFGLTCRLADLYKNTPIRR